MSDLLEVRRRNVDLVATQTADIVIVGGGINGVGIALDAAARGLKTVLVERDDIGVGTSSRSSKLIHGGLRYLEHYAFGLVREALGERHLLATSLAPHLVKIQRFLLPSYGSRLQVPYVAAGLSLYDVLGGRRDGWFRPLSKAKASQALPGLRHQTKPDHSGHQQNMRAAFVYSDGVLDDARYVTAVARTAVREGATILTKVEVTSFHKSTAQDSDGRVDGVVVNDRLSGDSFVIKAEVVVDATGAFDSDTTGSTVKPSRGIHLVVRRSLVDSEVGLTIRVPGRVIFLIPWGEFWLIGTTDIPHDGPIDRPTATAQEVSYLLQALDEVLNVNITIEDVIATYAGIRPLVGTDDDTSSISREEAIEEAQPGRITVRGGKFTTYRRIAERTVDLCVSTRLGPVEASTTKDIPLVGAIDGAGQALAVSDVVKQGFGPDVAEHLVNRYGSEASVVAQTAKDLKLSGRLVRGLQYLEIEAWWAIHHEQALSIDDVLSRRTRISITDQDHGLGGVEMVADMLGDALGWDRAARREAAEEYLAAAALEYGVPTQTPSSLRALPEGSLS